MNENQIEHQEHLKEQAQQHLEEAMQHPRWMSVSFYVDDKGMIQNAMVTHNFKHADYPTVLGDFKGMLDRDFFRYDYPRPLPLAPHIQRGGDNAETN